MAKDTTSWGKVTHPLGNVSWCFEPSQPHRITSGLNTNFTLSPSYSFHKSSNHKWCFLSLFIFRGHSIWEPASRRVTFYSAGLYRNHVLATANTGNIRRGFGKNAGEWTGRVEIGKGEIPGSKHGMCGYIALKGKCLSAVFSLDGTLISASAAPHCGATRQSHTPTEQSYKTLWAQPHTQSSKPHTQWPKPHIQYERESKHPLGNFQPQLEFHPHEICCGEGGGSPMTAYVTVVVVVTSWQWQHTQCCWRVKWRGQPRMPQLQTGKYRRGQLSAPAKSK